MEARNEPVIRLDEGFWLGRLGPQDQEALVEHMNDPEIARNLLAPPYPYTAADADEWIGRRARAARDPEVYFVVRAPTGRLIGGIGCVHEFGPDAYRAEIGYWLARSYRGRGLMPAALRAYAVHAFGALGLHRLLAHPFTFNAASARALEKAGFKREGHLRQHYRKNGLHLDAFVYGLLALEHGVADRR